MTKGATPCGAAPFPFLAKHGFEPESNHSPLDSQIKRMGPKMRLSD